jgi:hypothetical protein
MTLATLVSMLDDDPICGTGYPGKHPPRPGQIENLMRASFDLMALNPQPIPPGTEMYAILWQATRLYQLGQIVSAAKVSGNLGESLTRSANQLFDDYCGTIPRSVLLKIIIGHPPPPPPPWLDIVSQAVSTVLIANKAGGEIGKSLQGAAVSVIQNELARDKAVATRDKAIA